MEKPDKEIEQAKFPKAVEDAINEYRNDICAYKENQQGHPHERLLLLREAITLALAAAKSQGANEVRERIRAWAEAKKTEELDAAENCLRKAEINNSREHEGTAQGYRKLLAFLSENGEKPKEITDGLVVDVLTTRTFRTSTKHEIKPAETAKEEGK